MCTTHCKNKGPTLFSKISGYGSVEKWYSGVAKAVNQKWFKTWQIPTNIKTIAAS